MKRCFISIDLPIDIRNCLASDFCYWRDGKLMGLPIGWVELEKLHMTLVFLGDVGEDRIEKLVSCLEKLRFKKKIECELKGVGYFGEGSDLKVLYMGVVEKGLSELSKAVGSRISGCSFEFDDKPLSVHVTIGRFKRSLNKPGQMKINDLVRENNNRSWGKWQVSSFGLYESDKKEYKIIREFFVK